MANNNLYASIIVDIDSDAVDKAFLYLIPKDLESKVKIGDKVLFPFGKGNKEKEGFVISIDTKEDLKHSERAKNDEYLKKDESYDNAKAIISLAKNKLPVTDMLMDLAKFLSEEYLAPMSSCLKTVLPVKRELRKNKRRIDVIEKYEQKEIKKPILNEEQKQIITSLIESYNTHKFSNHLLYGITGSGKTEVFLNLIEQVIQDEKEVIVLIPEISLTYQTMIRLRERFGDTVGIINSSMSEGEKYLQIKKCLDKEIKILVGPRSAVFAPFENLGLIVMDEEDDNSYKSELTPRYDTYAVANYRCKKQNAMFLTLSATPTLSSFYESKNSKDVILHKLTKRASEKVCLPVCNIVDMRREYRNGNNTIFSKLLVEKINDRLKKKEQILLFMNRRGYNKTLTCIECGETIKCPHCDVPLTFHVDGSLKCHYCGYETKDIKDCPKCHSKKLNSFGIGTEKLEAKTRELFPNARVIRMDRDTVTKKDSYDEIVKKFNNKEADILIGTQMIVKGHDFSNVTLVGIMCADMVLNIEKYDAQEKAFSLLTQMSGRSGRKTQGECVIQTYNTENKLFDYIKEADYEKFYNDEIVFRKDFNYPPIKKLLVITMKSLVEEVVDIHAQNLHSYLTMNCEKNTVLGPVVPNPSKIKDNYFRNLYVKCNDLDEAKEIRKKAYEFIRNKDTRRELMVIFDIDR